MPKSLKLLLADDDMDDCLFFKDAIGELQVNCELITVHNGVELMRMLSSNQTLPDALFLDLNMPRKNGYECLVDIKRNEKLNKLPVVIYSTSFDPEVVELLFERGAHHYIRKPGDYLKLKNVIERALKQIRKNDQPEREEFIIA